MLPFPAVIRPMRENEAATVAALTRECPEAAQWSAKDYGVAACAAEEWHGRGSCVLIAASASGLIGFLAVRAVAEELEVLNLGVAAAARRSGLATRMLEAAFAAARAAGAAKVFCEVRESNAGGRAFYAAHGFREAGRRAKYYASPVEDALVLSREL